MQFFDYVARCEAAGKAFALLTIIEATDGSPGRNAFKLCYQQGGEIFGSIGGGALEYQAMQEAEAMLQRGESMKILEMELQSKEEGGIGMACGGSVKVLIECFSAQRPLYIFGGGHIGTALTEFATRVGFSVTVIDDRPEFATQERHPLATEVRCESYESAAAQGEFKKNAFFVIVTHQHIGDAVTLKGLLKRASLEPHYVGLIGSAKKLAKVFKYMLEEGIEETALRKVHAPIGVNHGGQNAPEIAMSIATEIIASKYGKTLKSSMREERSPWALMEDSHF